MVCSTIQQPGGAGHRTTSHHHHHHPCSSSPPLLLLLSALLPLQAKCDEGRSKEVEHRGGSSLTRIDSACVACAPAVVAAAVPFCGFFGLPPLVSSSVRAGPSLQCAPNGHHPWRRTKRSPLTYNKQEAAGRTTASRQQTNCGGSSK